MSTISNVSQYITNNNDLCISFNNNIACIDKFLLTQFVTILISFGVVFLSIIIEKKKVINKEKNDTKIELLSTVQYVLSSTISLKKALEEKNIDLINTRLEARKDINIQMHKSIAKSKFYFPNLIDDLTTLENFIIKREYRLNKAKNELLEGKKVTNQSIESFEENIKKIKEFQEKLYTYLQK